MISFLYCHPQICAAFILFLFFGSFYIFIFFLCISGEDDERCVCFCLHIVTDLKYVTHIFTVLFLFIVFVCNLVQKSNICPMFTSHSVPSRVIKWKNLEFADSLFNRQLPHVHLMAPLVATNENHNTRKQPCFLLALVYFVIFL